VELIKSRIAAYQDTGEGLPDLVRELTLRAYRYALGKTDPDVAGEMVADLIPRLPAMLDRYRDSGIPFEHYFNSVICWRLKAELRRQTKERQGWRAARLLEFWPVTPQNDSERQGDTTLSVELLSVFNSWSKGKLMDPAEKKRLQLAALRKAWTLTQEQIEETAFITNVPVSWLQDRVAALREALAPRLARLEQLRRRRDTAYARMRLAQQRLADETDPLARKELRGLAARNASIWKKSTDALAHVALVPTHRQLARELGIPRGTVGTALRWLQLRVLARKTEQEQVAG
jgi:hypothetical protein